MFGSFEDFDQEKMHKIEEEAWAVQREMIGGGQDVRFIRRL